MKKFFQMIARLFAPNPQVTRKDTAILAEGQMPAASDLSGMARREPVVLEEPAAPAPEPAPEPAALPEEPPAPPEPERERSPRVGDTVKWQSQAAGSWKEKQGKIVAIVPPRRKPENYCPRDLSFHAGGCLTRDHESYLVHVPTESGRGRGTVYWPLVKNLRRV